MKLTIAQDCVNSRFHKYKDRPNRPDIFAILVNRHASFTNFNDIMPPSSDTVQNRNNQICPQCVFGGFAAFGVV